MVHLSRAVFEALVRDALTTLPEEFIAALDNVAVVVEDEPDPQTLRELRVAPDEELFGLYAGVSLLDRSVEHAGLPDRIYIYRGPILRSCRGYDEVVREVTETVVHELGHHMGLSDDEMVY